MSAICPVRPVHRRTKLYRHIRGCSRGPAAALVLCCSLPRLELLLKVELQAAAGAVTETVSDDRRLQRGDLITPPYVMSINPQFRKRYPVTSALIHKVLNKLGRPFVDLSSENYGLSYNAQAQAKHMIIHHHHSLGQSDNRFGCVLQHVLGHHAFEDDLAANVAVLIKGQPIRGHADRHDVSLGAHVTWGKHPTPAGVICGGCNKRDYDQRNDVVANTARRLDFFNDDGLIHNWLARILRKHAAGYNCEAGARSDYLCEHGFPVMFE